MGTAAERRDKIAGAAEADVLITSYDLLKRDILYYEDLHFHYEIIDEAQYIKNHNTQKAKSVKVINSAVRFALTGTPVENSLAELWSIYDFLMPGYLYTCLLYTSDIIHKSLSKSLWIRLSNIGSCVVNPNVLIQHIFDNRLIDSRFTHCELRFITAYGNDAGYCAIREPFQCFAGI